MSLAHFMNKELARGSLCEHFDSHSLALPCPPVDVRKEPNPDLLLAVDLIPGNGPTRQRHLCRAQPAQRVDTRLDELPVKGIPRSRLRRPTPVARRLPALHTRDSRAPAQVRALPTRAGSRRRADRRDEHGVLVLRLRVLALDLVLERALQRLDRLGHLVAPDLEHADHLDVVVRRECVLHQLPHVCGVDRGVVLVLARSDEAQHRADLLRACDEQLLDRRDGREMGDIGDGELKRVFLGHGKCNRLPTGNTPYVLEESSGVDLSLLLRFEDLFKNADLDRKLFIGRYQLSGIVVRMATYAEHIQGVI